MGTQDLIKGVSGIKGIESQAAAERAVKYVFETIQKEVAAGNKVTITGFGTFQTSERQEREGRNPQTGESIIIPARKSVKFSAGKYFKDAVN